MAGYSNLDLHEISGVMEETEENGKRKNILRRSEELDAKLKRVWGKSYEGHNKEKVVTCNMR